jgi:hypothetical protein
VRRQEHGWGTTGTTGFDAQHEHKHDSGPHHEPQRRGRHHQNCGLRRGTIAGLAAREVAGGQDLTPAGLTQAFGTITGRMTGQDQLERGVAVQVGEVECIVDLNIVVDSGASIPQLADAL